MRKTLVKIIKAILRRLENGHEPTPPMTEKQIHLDGGQTGIIGDGAKVKGGIHLHTKADASMNTTELLAVYRQMLLKSFQHLTLRGLDEKTSDPAGNQCYLALDQVYVALDTLTQVKLSDAEKKAIEKADRFIDQDTRPLTALEASANNRRLVILGDPGSGKTTFLNHLALRLLLVGMAQETCDTLTGWSGDETDIVPVHVVLRDFASWIKDADETAEAQWLWKFIEHRMDRQRLTAVIPVIEKALEKGRAIVLMDGLDEIPTKEKRRFVRDAVAAFAERYGKCRFIVTCRTLSYQNPAWRLNEADFPDFELAPLDKNKIDAFIHAWYQDLRRLQVLKDDQDADRQSSRLQEAVRRPDLWKLAPNPLLLTVMALVHTHKGRLPDARALLYEETVDILLWRWEQVKMAGDKSKPRLQTLLLEAGRADVDLKKVLWQLAYDAHGQTHQAEDETLADIKEWDLSKGLAGLHPSGSKDWATQVIETIKMRAGLLIEREPEVYSFPHRTFQEYLAGAHLSSQSDFAKKAVGLIESGNFWREVVLLAVGRLVYLTGDAEKPLALAGELCPIKTADDEAGWRKIWMAGEVLVEIGLNRVQDSHLGQDLLERIKKKLVALVESGRLTPKERVAAGNALSRLGDPRFGAENWFLPDDEDLGFVEIPAGPFMMGEGNDRHEVVLSAYSMARYPVTVAQYKAFATEAGYQMDEGWERYNQLDNHPVVVVSWDDAKAYCLWLTEKLKDCGLRVTLPTEAQWERGARGTDARVYPWGDEKIDPEKANYIETGISSNSPVGCFPKGKSADGLHDLAGNVWEWCLDHCDWEDGVVTDTYKDDVQDPICTKGSFRVLRGGAWFHPAEFCRAAIRYGYDPGDRYQGIGFRLVCLPGQPGEPGK